MSVTLSKADGRTVITVTSDPKCAWPPLCQILQAHCINPLCCSVSQQLRRVQGTSQSVLGATQIMVAVINIYFGTILINNGASSWQLLEYWYPIWFGFLFAGFGIMSILSERYPSTCLVTASVIANLAGVAFAIAAIILYGFNRIRIELWLCRRSEWDWYRLNMTMPPTPSVEEMIMMDKCIDAQEKVRVLVQSISTMLVVMSILELCLVTSSAVLGIKALVMGQKEASMVQESTDDPNLHKFPLLKEVATITA